MGVRHRCDADASVCGETGAAEHTDAHLPPFEALLPDGRRTKSRRHLLRCLQLPARTLEDVDVPVVVVGQVPPELQVPSREGTTVAELARCHCVRRLLQLLRVCTEAIAQCCRMRRRVIFTDRIGRRVARPGSVQPPRLFRDATVRPLRE